jgi:hypothetical protein
VLVAAHGVVGAPSRTMTGSNGVAPTEAAIFKRSLIGCPGDHRHEGGPIQTLILIDPRLRFRLGGETEHGLARAIATGYADVEAGAVVMGEDGVLCHPTNMARAELDCIPCRRGSSEIHVVTKIRSRRCEMAKNHFPADGAN